MKQIYFIDAGKAYGPFDAERIALEYMAEIGMVEAAPMRADAGGLPVRAPSAEFLAMVNAPGYFADDATPVAERAHRLTGPSWHDEAGHHETAFHRINTARPGDTRRDGWQVVDYCNGELCQVIDMPNVCPDVCDTATGALWALRGIVAHWMRSDVRSTRGH